MKVTGSVEEIEKSENVAFFSSYVHLSQLGNHATEPGFSGRAIINGENLYSLNRGLSMGEQHGVMISNMVKDITLFVPEFHQQGARLEFLVDHSIFSDHLSIFSDFAPSYGVIPYSKFKDAINNVSHNQWLDQKKEGSQKVFHIYDDPSKCGRYFNNPYELHLTVILDPNSDWVKKFHFTLREKGEKIDPMMPKYFMSCQRKLTKTELLFL